jgi:hypothetical protein
MSANKMQDGRAALPMFWEIAGQLFLQDGLKAPALLLVNAARAEINVFRPQGSSLDQFKETVLEKASCEQFTSAVSISRVQVAFAALDDGSKPFSDYEAILVVVATKSGAREIESSRIYVSKDKDVTLGEPMGLEIPISFIADEVAALGVTIH